jgi:hypothetical protein
MVGEQLYSFDRGVLRWLGAALGTGVVLFGAMLLAWSNRVCRLRHLAGAHAHTSSSSR